MRVRPGAGFRQLVLLLALACGMATPTLAAKPGWDRAKTVRVAAERLAELQKRQGAEAVAKFLDACYRTHTLASKFSEPLDTCMAQDLMFSEVLATVYGRLTPEARRERKLPSPEQISASLAARIGSVVTQYKLKDADTKALADAVAAHGMPIFLAAMFPKAGEPPKP